LSFRASIYSAFLYTIATTVLSSPPIFIVIP